MDSQQHQQPQQPPQDGAPRLYFAYGSNLSTVQMRRRCPKSTPVGLGLLAGWRWIINTRGYANVVPSAEGDDARVYGLLYAVPARDEQRLDGYEGVPRAYEKMECEVRRVHDGGGGGEAEAGEAEAGEAVTALVYVDRERVVEGVPRDEYVVRMERAATDAVANWGMAREYADTVMRRFWTPGGQ